MNVYSPGPAAGLHHASAAGLQASYWPADTSQPLLDTTVGSILRDAAERRPAAVALVDGQPDPARRRTWTYAELLAEAERAARALLARFEPGERVAVMAGACPEWIILEFATALAGLVLIPVNPALQAAELRHVLADSQGRGILLTSRYRAADLPSLVAQARPGTPDLRAVISLDDWDALMASGTDDTRLPTVTPDAPALVLYTSGTTGKPKGAVLTHRGLTNNARLACAAMGLLDGDTSLNPMPLFHVAGSGLLSLGLVQHTCTQVLPPYFDPGLVLELTETYRSAMIGGVPAMLQALLAHPASHERDLSSLRLGIAGGAPVPAAIVRQVEERLGVPLLITFGQTETSCSITVGRPDDSADDRAETVGRPLPQTEVKIVSLRDGAIAELGEPGEILVRGYLVMHGYLGTPGPDPAAVDADGWLRTGDLGTMDHRGYLRIVGRIKEMIIRGGENIYPREIEDALMAHPAIAEAAVVPVPSGFWGEEVGAAIRLVPAAPTPSTGELAEFCRQRLAAFKIPSHWLIVDAIPHTDTGKVRKDALAASFPIA
jgi:fatty-acyl-CoA synthase